MKRRHLGFILLAVGVALGLFALIPPLPTSPDTPSTTTEGWDEVISTEEVSLLTSGLKAQAVATTGKEVKETDCTRTGCPAPTTGITTGTTTGTTSGTCPKGETDDIANPGQCCADTSPNNNICDTCDALTDQIKVAEETYDSCTSKCEKQEATYLAAQAEVDHNCRPGNYGDIICLDAITTHRDALYALILTCTVDKEHCMGLYNQFSLVYGEEKTQCTTTSKPECTDLIAQRKEIETQIQKDCLGGYCPKELEALTDLRTQYQNECTTPSSCPAGQQPDPNDPRQCICPAGQIINTQNPRQCIAITCPTNYYRDTFGACIPSPISGSVRNLQQMGYDAVSAVGAYQDRMCRYTEIATLPEGMTLLTFIMQQKDLVPADAENLTRKGNMVYAKTCTNPLFQVAPRQYRAQYRGLATERTGNENYMYNTGRDDDYFLYSDPLTQGLRTRTQIDQTTRGRYNIPTLSFFRNRLNRVRSLIQNR